MRSPKVKHNYLLSKQVMSVAIGFGLVLFGQAGINGLPKSVTKAAAQGHFDSQMIEEFGANTLGKAIVKKVHERPKPELAAKDAERGNHLFRSIRNQPIVVSVSSNDLESFHRRGLGTAFENPLAQEKMNLNVYNQQISAISGIRFPNVLDIRGEENREFKLWNSLRPKNGYVLPNRLLGRSIHNGKFYEAPSEGLELWSPMENEGNIILVLKDHVKEFSTFTFGSLTKDVPLKDASSRVFTFFDKPAGDPKKRELPWEARYLEVQIWGEVGAADVKEIWVSASADVKVQDVAKKLGVPVFKFKRKSVDAEDKRGVAYEIQAQLQ